MSVWTDPDSTDDGSAAGRFWVTLRPSSGASLPADTRVNVAINPADEARPAKQCHAPSPLRTIRPIASPRW